MTHVISATNMIFLQGRQAIAPPLPNDVKYLIDPYECRSIKIRHRNGRKEAFNVYNQPQLAPTTVCFEKSHDTDTSTTDQLEPRAMSIRSTASRALLPAQHFCSLSHELMMTREIQVMTALRYLIALALLKTKRVTLRPASFCSYQYRSCMEYGSTTN